MATAQQFEDMGVWQGARRLVKEIYAASKQRPFYRHFSVRDQIRRASASTISNIAKGSNGEVRSHLYVALDQEHVTPEASGKLREKALALSRRLAKFIRYLESCSSNSRVRKSARR